MNYRLVLSVNSAAGPKVFAVTIYKGLGGAGLDLTDVKEAP